MWLIFKINRGTRKLIQNYLKKIRPDQLTTTWLRKKTITRFCHSFVVLRVWYVLLIPFDPNNTLGKQRKVHTIYLACLKWDHSNTRIVTVTKSTWKISQGIGLDSKSVLSSSLNKNKKTCMNVLSLDIIKYPIRIWKKEYRVQYLSITRASTHACIYAIKGI